jgi:hypothetical protein
MIPGDANQDQYVDGLDQNIWIGQNGLDGYRSADFNGDFYVDGLDQTIWIMYNGASSWLPCNIFTLSPGEHHTKNINGNFDNGKNKTQWNVFPRNNVDQGTQKSKKK